MAAVRDDRAAPARALRDATLQSLRLDRDALVWPRAARQTAGVAICLFGGHLLGHPVPGVFAGIAALLTAVWSTFLGGRREVTGTVPAVVALAIGTAIGVWAHEHVWIVLPLAALGAAATGLLTTRPAPWSTAGTALTFGLVVTGAIEPFVQPAWVRGLVVAAGGLVQLGLVVLTWPLQGVRPERRALRLLMRDVTRQLETADDEAPLLPPVVPLPTLSAALQSPQPFAGAGATAVVRAEYRAVVELRRTVARFLLDVRRAETAGFSAVREVRLERRLAARASRLLAGPRHPGWRTRTRRALDELWAACAAWRSGPAGADNESDEVRAATRALAEALEAVAEPLLVGPGRAGGPGDPGPAVGVYAPPGASRGPGVVIDGLRAAARDPLARVHAVRMAVGITIAVAAGLLLPVQRGYWIALVVLVVLRPVVADTTGRLVARAVGTVLGVAVTLPVLGRPGDEAALLGFGVVLAGVAVLTFGASYLLFTAGVTGFVCLLLTLSGDPIRELAIARVVDTGIGLAVVAAVALVAPSWEIRRTGAQLAAALEAQLDYLGLALDRLAAPVDPDAVVVAESRAVNTRLAAGESVRRVRQEPRVGGDRWDTVGPAVVALLEQQAHRSLVLHAQLDAGRPSGVDGEDAAALRSALPGLRDELAAALRDGGRVADVADGIARIAATGEPTATGESAATGADDLRATARTVLQLHELVARAVR